MEKGVVVEYILSLIKENIKLLEEELDSIKKEKNSLTKSTAGDKHETSRALMQSEYDKLYQNYSLQLKQQKVIETLDLSKKSVIGNGSLVQTDRFFYFIGIGLGKHKIMSNNVMLISELSPIGKLLVGRNKNDVISFNNKKETIINFS